ncbi:MAG TPA: CHAD domain-containing protein [Terriglobia bacterium]|nr:CHAD domain-containing protein [Terriglobia bacterium]
MSFDIERIRKSTRRITKFLRKNSKTPSPNAIHNLRISTRTLETTFITLGLNSKRKVKRLLRGLGDVRKRAGKVRDMDVLTADTLTVRQDGDEDCQVQLLEYLGAERNKCARKLRLVIEAASPQLRRDLKRNSKRVKKLLKRAESNPAGSHEIPVTMARAIQLSSELGSPARLSRNNLHPYRLKVKELRNVLQLSDQAGGQEFLEKLGEVKDAIGEWHDWEELIAIAAQLLDHGPSCNLMKHLRETSNSKYERAFLLTSHFRDSYLKSERPKRGTHHTRTATLSAPVLRATSAIAQH